MTGQPDGHLDDRRLAAIASGEVPDHDEQSHLWRCPGCSGACAELVRLRARELAGKVEVPSAILAAGHEFVTHRFGGAVPARTHRARRNLIRIAPALAIAALVLVMVVRQPSDTSTAGGEIPDWARIALIGQGATGMINPLVADAKLLEAEPYRGESEFMIASSLDELQQRVEGEGSSVDATADLVAVFQAADQLENARAYLDIALEEHVNDGRLRGLQIYQDYLEGNSDLAVIGLRDRLRAEPGDLLARLNLAILLHGDAATRAESMKLASEVVDSVGEATGLGRRAKGLCEAPG